MWVHIRKERHPKKRGNKLDDRAEGPFQVLQRLNNNSYIIDVPDGFGGTSATFNIKDLKLYNYHEPPQQDTSDSRTNPFQQGGTDVATNRNDPLVQINRPLTRAQKRRMDAALNSLVVETFERENSLPSSFQLYNELNVKERENNPTT